MGDAILRQAILHATVAAVFVEAILGAWGIRRAESRLPFWLLALAFPFLILPAYFLAAPFRLDDHFAARFALLASSRWNAVQVAGWGMDTAVLTAFAVLGTMLLLRDLVPLIVDALREPRERGTSQAPAPTELVDVVRRQATGLRIPVPAIELLAMDAPVLFVRGFTRHTLVLSAGLLKRLSAGQLEAVMAHELAHVRFRDPLTGWGLLAARAVMFWNPAVQLVARAIVEETERRADAVAVRAAGRADFEIAFRVLSDGQAADAAVDRGVGAALVDRLHRRHVAARVAALDANLPPQPFGWRLALAGATLASLLFFVV